mgnify:CR=1 FL=1
MDVPTSTLGEQDRPRLERRAEVHRALGDPLRLAIIDALALSDLSPSEVEVRLDVPSNLLAHHLGILEATGLVQRSRSQGDGRRRYLSLHRDALEGVEPGAPSFEATRVVFVCTANSARSPLASAIWDDCGTNVPSTSAGTHPADVVHPLAREAARQHGMLIDHRPQALGAIERPGDLVVTVCDQAHEEGVVGGLHWSIPDPARDGRPEAFLDVIARLRERVTALAQANPTHVLAGTGSATP